jgi:hypothetical protein
MKVIAIYEDVVGEGRDFTEAFSDLKVKISEFGNTDPSEPDEVSFYEVGDPIRVEMKIVPKEVIVKQQKLPK